ncbi:endothelial cell-specific chemotaxis regulator isoform X3 [Gopherus evgoodei]|uniref:endothelial cell-specific chemotaxis regulator isoform X3 n=1 Tax=Gopherus evgoodei TaxID=1825980 RepID=UPI0011CFA393|nr:endothelial cell-specific chemotaxis regulator isoform X3 [Gopherus evgoodei]
MLALNVYLLLWVFGCIHFIDAEAITSSLTRGGPAGASKQVTSTTIASDWSTGPSLPDPTPTEEKSALTVAAFGVISFIVILVVVVIVLASVVSLRFKCNRSKDAEDKQKPGSSMVSESSCSPATAKDSITLISMKNLSMNNSTSYPSSEKVL